VKEGEIGIGIAGCKKLEFGGRRGDRHKDRREPGWARCKQPPRPGLAAFKQNALKALGSEHPRQIDHGYGVGEIRGIWRSQIV